MSKFTKKEFDAAVALMRKNRVKPKIVKSRRQAKNLTETDPSGHKWAVGDEYYEAHTCDGIFPVI